MLSQISDKLLHSNTVAEQIKQYLDSLESNEFDTETMSRTLGYSREHITRVFHTTYRTTPRRYLDMRKMNTALEKLYAGESLQSVAEQLNYATPYSLSKAFKKHFGSSPMQYIKALKRNEPAFKIPSNT